MKNIYLVLLVLFATILLSENGYCQTNSPSKVSHKSFVKPNKTNFSVVPFTPYFVENKGQFDQYNVNKGNKGFNSPLYGSQMGNAVVLFNRNSIQFVENIAKRK